MIKRLITILMIAVFLSGASGCAPGSLLGPPEPVVIIGDDQTETLAGGEDAASIITMPTEGSRKAYHLAILVNFLDTPLQTSEEEWEAFFYGSRNSLRGYYLDQSKGMITVSPVSETYGERDNGVIIVDAEMLHPNLATEEDSRSDITAELLDEVLFKADEFIDFSAYDKNRDSLVLQDELVITVVAAGYEYDPNHVFDENAVSGLAITEKDFLYYDGVGINNFLLTGEIHFDYEGNEIFPTIGVACHEFGHALGLPDLYDTDSSTAGLDFHALMASGASNGDWNLPSGTTPAPLIAWSRAFLGLIEPEVVSESGEYRLYARSQDQYNVIKIAEKGGYYLLENVDFAGYGAGLDVYMAAPGIAIWYIDDEKTSEDIIIENTVNDDDNQRGVSLIEAGGTRDLYEEQLDYSRENYMHYFSKSNVGTFATNSGTVINFLSDPGNEMLIEILMAN